VGWWGSSQSRGGTTISLKYFGEKFLSLRVGLDSGKEGSSVKMYDLFGESEKKEKGGKGTFSFRGKRGKLM